MHALYSTAYEESEDDQNLDRWMDDSRPVRSQYASEPQGEKPSKPRGYLGSQVGVAGLRFARGAKKVKSGHGIPYYG